VWYLQRVSGVRFPNETKPPERGTWRPSRRLVLVAKFLVTGMCLWYLARRIDLGEVIHAAGNLDLGWAMLAVVALMIQTPLVSLRWSKIVDALGHGSEPVRRLPILAISAIVTFFAQVMPNVASESVRVWMLAGLGVGWQRALASILIDRGIGIGALLAVALMTLLPSSGLAASAGIRVPLAESLAGVLGAGIAGLVLTPYLGAILERWRYTSWVGKLARAAHDVLLKTTAGASITGLAVGVQLLAIASIWLLGRSLGLALTIGDAGVLYTVIFGSILLPISIGGWGVRELAVTAVLSTVGIPVEQSLLFSASFGLALVAAGLPGAVVWAYYVPPRLEHAAKQE
jgi:glycosyltransferase 2 family protein